MPDVDGQQLDVAEKSIKSAGFDDDVKVVGGGTFGIVDKSNWTVCEQTPAAGQVLTAAPQLTVDRSCDKGSTPSATPPAAASSSSSKQPSKAPSTSKQPSKKPSARPGKLPAILTVKNNKELAALLRVADPGDPRVAGFATKYSGKIIEFDANIVNVAPHGNKKTIKDVLIVAGDYDPNSQIGPSFQLFGVDMFDIPGGGLVGQNIHIRATVGDYNATQEIFHLDPVPITITPRN